MTELRKAARALTTGVAIIAAALGAALTAHDATHTPDPWQPLHTTQGDTP